MPIHSQTNLEYAQQPKDAQVFVPHARVRVGLRVGSPHRQPKVPAELEADVDDVGDDRAEKQQRAVGVEELSEDEEICDGIELKEEENNNSFAKYCKIVLDITCL